MKVRIAARLDYSASLFAPARSRLWDYEAVNLIEWSLTLPLSVDTLAETIRSLVAE